MSRTGFASRVLAVGVMVAVTFPAAAQFVSGSSGVSGEFTVASNMTLTLNDTGVYEFTTLTVNPGVTLSFQNNALNTPVVFLCTGDALIDGTINAAGANGAASADPQAGSPGSEAVPGPGGFPGGVGGNTEIGVISPGTAGGGPGGGAAAGGGSTGTAGRGRAGNGGSHFTAGVQAGDNPNPPSPTYGDPRLITLTGGSGGAGSDWFVTSNTTFDGAGGGAGGGAILIASSGTITVNGSVLADGGESHGATGTAGGGGNGSGSGAGGTIRLMANTITGSGSLDATGGADFPPGGLGLIRLEAFDVSGSLETNSNPSPVTSSPTVVSFDPADVPTVTITSIGGVAVPMPPDGDTAMPDVTIPSSTPNPLDVAISTANVPDGSVINVRLTLEDGSIVEASSDPVMSDATTASVTLPPGVGVVYATADFDPMP